MSPSTVRNESRIVDAKNPPEPSLGGSHPGAIHVVGALRRLQQEIADSGDLDSGLQLMARGARQLLEASAVAIALVTDVPEVLTCCARCGSGAPALGAKLHVGSGFSGRCIGRGTTEICADTENDVRVDPEQCRILGARSLLAVPVQSGRRIIGLIEAFSAQPSAFDRDDILVLERLARTLVDFLSKPPAPHTATQASYIAPALDTTLQRADGGFPTGDSSCGSLRPRFSLLRMILVVGMIGTGLLVTSRWIERHLHEHDEANVTHTTGRSNDVPAGPAAIVATQIHLEDLDLVTLERKADAGDVTAQDILAERYLEGDEIAGLKPDEKQAAHWFSVAAEQGNTGAQSRLAYLFWTGRGVPQDMHKAYFWAAVASRSISSSTEQPAVTLAQTLKRVLSYSTLSPAQAAAIESKAAAWQPRRP